MSPVSKKLPSLISPYLFAVPVIGSSRVLSPTALVTPIDPAMLMVGKELRFRAPIEDVNFMRTERTRRYYFSDQDFASSPINSQGSGGSFYSPEKDDREVTEHQMIQLKRKSLTTVNMETTVKRNWQRTSSSFYHHCQTTSLLASGLCPSVCR